jgi:hypothetical protein
MAGKKKAKKAGAKKAAKKAPARKAGAKKAGSKKASAKKAGVRRGQGKPPAKAAVKGEAVLEIDVETEEGKKKVAEKLGKAWEKHWARVVAKTWTDPAFKQQLLESPAAVLGAEGLPLLHDVEIRIVSGEGRFTMEIPLPDRPIDLDGELIDDLLEDLEGGKGHKPKKCVMSSCCC